MLGSKPSDFRSLLAFKFLKIEKKRLKRRRSRKRGSKNQVWLPDFEQIFGFSTSWLYPQNWCWAGQYTTLRKSVIKSLLRRGKVWIWSSRLIAILRRSWCLGLELFHARNFTHFGLIASGCDWSNSLCIALITLTSISLYIRKRTQFPGLTEPIAL